MDEKKGLYICLEIKLSKILSFKMLISKNIEVFNFTNYSVLPKTVSKYARGSGYSIEINGLNSLKNCFFLLKGVFIFAVNFTGTASYRGFFLQVLDSSNSPAGKFEGVDENLYQYLNCPNSFPSSTVTHKSRVDKSVADFVWMPPAGCNGNTYTVR